MSDSDSDYQPSITDPRFNTFFQWCVLSLFLQRSGHHHFTSTFASQCLTTPNLLIGDLLKRTTKGT